MSVTSFANILFYSVSCTLILFMISFAVQNSFELIWVSFVYFCFYDSYCRRWIEKDLVAISVEECSSVFSSKDFIVQFSSVQSLSRVRLFVTP